MKRSIVILSIVVVVLAIFAFLAPATTKQVADKATKKLSQVTIPLEYQRLTIPYLQSRSYRSALGLRTVYQQQASYTSYLSSYLSDGLKINGLLTIPKGEKPARGWPAIVFIHGYIPPSQYVTTERYGAYVDYLARNGFVVFKIDLRGHGQSEGKAQGAYFSSDYVIDTLNAYAALKSSDFIDSNKIGLWGHSMAGNIVLRSVAAYQSVPAAVIWAGAGYSYQDLFTYRIQDPSYQQGPNFTNQSSLRQRLLKEFGDPARGGVIWKEIAPINFISSTKTALEIHHAEDDDVVSINYSRDLIKALDETKVVHAFYTYPVGGHNISDPSFAVAMQRTVDFYTKYLSERR